MCLFLVFCLGDNRHIDQIDLDDNLRNLCLPARLLLHIEISIWTDGNTTLVLPLIFTTTVVKRLSLAEVSVDDAK